MDPSKGRRYTQVKAQTSRDHFMEAIEEQWQLAQQEIKQKQTYIQRLNALVKKADRRFKLKKPDILMRHNRLYFDEAKTLPTFVDSRNQIEKTNLLNDTQMMQRLQAFREAKKYQINLTEKAMEEVSKQEFIDELKLKDPFPTKRQIEDLGYMTIDFLGTEDCFKNNQIDKEQYIYTKNLIQRAQNVVEKIQEVKEHKVQGWLSQQLGFITQDESQEPQFFSIQSHRLSKSEDKTKNRLGATKSLNHLRRESNLFQETAQIIKKKYGLDIRDKQIDIYDIHRSFKQKSQMMIRQVRQNANSRIKTHQDETKDSKIEKLDFSAQRRSIKLTYDSRQRRSIIIENFPRDKGNVSHPISPIKVSTEVELFEVDKPLNYNEINNFQNEKILSDIEIAYQDMQFDRQDDEQIIETLDQEVELMKKKHEIKRGIKDVGFQNKQLFTNLKPSVRANSKITQKNMRTLKILKYF